MLPSVLAGRRPVPTTPLPFQTMSKPHHIHAHHIHFSTAAADVGLTVVHCNGVELTVPAGSAVSVASDNPMLLHVFHEHDGHRNLVETLIATHAAHGRVTVHLDASGAMHIGPAEGEHGKSLRKSG